jgi:hypothetical protein
MPCIWLPVYDSSELYEARCTDLVLLAVTTSIVQSKTPADQAHN